MPQWILALIKLALEILANEIEKIITAPDVVLEDAKPVLQHLDPIADDSLYNDGLLTRYGGLR
jgi:hypothetical protein